MAALVALLVAAAGCSVAGGGPAPALRVNASGAGLFEPPVVAEATPCAAAMQAACGHVWLGGVSNCLDCLDARARSLPRGLPCAEAEMLRWCAQSGVQNWTVLPDTDFVGAMAYSSTPVNSIDECAAQCLARSDCVATSWNGPKSLLHNRLCNFDCKTSGRRHLKGETGAIMTSRHGSNLCNKPHPPPPPAPPPPPLPDDWKARVSTGWFIASTGQPLSSDLCPTIGNGFVAATICPPTPGDIESSGGTFLSGFYSGKCPAPSTGNGNARATLPTPHGIFDLQGATYVGMALDIQNATVIRRFRLSSCQVDVKYLAHREARHLMVLSFTGSGFGSGPCVVKPTLPAPGPLDQQCRRQGDVKSCNSTATPENERQTPTVVSIHADTVPDTMTLSEAAPHFTLRSAFASNLEPGVEATEAIDVAKQRYQAAKGLDLQTLEGSHARAWSVLWQSGATIGGNVTATAALRSSYYYILSSVRADWPFGSSPGGLPSTSYHGHCFWDMGKIVILSRFACCPSR